MPMAPTRAKVAASPPSLQPGPFFPKSMLWLPGDQPPAALTAEAGLHSLVPCGLELPDLADVRQTARARLRPRLDRCRQLGCQNREPDGRGSSRVSHWHVTAADGGECGTFLVAAVLAGQSSPSAPALPSTDRARTRARSVLAARRTAYVSARSSCRSGLRASATLHSGEAVRVGRAARSSARAGGWVCLPALSSSSSTSLRVSDTTPSSSRAGASRWPSSASSASRGPTVPSRSCRGVDASLQPSCVLSR